MLKIGFLTMFLAADVVFIFRGCLGPEPLDAAPARWVQPSNGEYNIQSPPIWRGECPDSFEAWRYDETRPPICARRA